MKVRMGGRAALLVAGMALSCARSTAAQQPSTPSSPVTQPALDGEDRRLVAKVQGRAAATDAAGRAALARELLRVAQQTLAPTWLEQRRERVARANAAAGLRPTREQFEAQLQLWQTEHVERVLGAMQHVGTPELVGFALGLAVDGSAPLKRRKLALELVDRLPSVTTADQARAREAARGSVMAAEAAQRRGPQGVAQVVAGMRSAFRRCYREQLARAPADHDGRVSFTIGTTGQAGSVAVEKLPPEMARCVERVVLASTFQLQDQPTRVAVPIKFVATGESATAKVPCFDYEPSVVSLNGVLESRVFPGPPNYEDVTKGDKPETVWVLRLEQPICLEAGAGLGQPGRLGIAAVQLVILDGQDSSYRDLLNRSVVARGRLFGAHTGHHHLETLLNVEQLKLR